MGAFKNIIYRAPGNHEWYDSPDGQGYFDYFDGVGQNDGRHGVREFVLGTGGKWLFENAAEVAVAELPTHQGPGTASAAAV